jgi:hypothetical protein
MPKEGGSYVVEPEEDNSLRVRRATESQIEQAGVGPAPKGTVWMVKGGNLNLLDRKRGVIKASIPLDRGAVSKDSDSESIAPEQVKIADSTPSKRDDPFFTSTLPSDLESEPDPKRRQIGPETVVQGYEDDIEHLAMKFGRGRPPRGDKPGGPPTRKAARDKESSTDDSTERDRVIKSMQDTEVSRDTKRPSGLDSDPKRPADPIKAGEGSTSGSPSIDPEDIEFLDPPAPPDLPKSGRFEGQRPDDLDLEAIGRSVTKPKISEDTIAITTPEPEIDSPEVTEFLESTRIQLGDGEERKPSRVEAPDVLDLAKQPAMAPKGSPEIIKDIVEQTQLEVGSFVPSAGFTIITEDALRDASEPTAPFRLEIDPNSNIATIYDAKNTKLDTYKVGTGDITGRQYGKKYYSPVGAWTVVNEIPYGEVEGSYGPWWMGLTAPKSPGGSGYGLHGPHKRADQAPEGGFINKGYVSHGCVRFSDADILSVGEYLDKGSSVRILPYKTPSSKSGAVR